MTDIFRVLAESHRSHLNKVMQPGSPEYPEGEWQALKLIESLAEMMIRRTSAALPRGYDLRVSGVNFNRFERSGYRGKLLLKAQLYPAGSEGRRKGLLKVFIHEEDRKGKTKRLARAVYYLHIGRGLNRNVA